MKVIVVIAAAVGVSFYLIAMYACLVVASQMDDEMDLYRRKREEHYCAGWGGRRNADEGAGESGDGGVTVIFGEDDTKLIFDHI